MARILGFIISVLLSTQALGVDEFCDEYKRKNIPLAKKIKEDLKADARFNGLPERLMYLFDQLGDCPMCIDGDRDHPIWPVIVIDYHDDHPDKPGPLRNVGSRMVEWSGDMEYLTREGMREGWVKSYHILLETTPCECCETDTREEFDEWNESKPDPQDSPTWDPELGIDTSVADSHDDPDNLGEDPPDLVDLPEEESGWEMVEWPPLVLPPPERPMTTLCSVCQDEVRIHNDMTVRMNKHARVIARLVRTREGTLGLMRERLRKIRSLKQKGSTPEVLAARDKLWTEYEGFLGESITQTLRIKELFEERNAFFAQLELLKAAVRECEARCIAKDAQALPATEPSAVTSTTELPGKTRIASQACPGCEDALDRRNTLARQMNKLVDAMAGTAVTDASLAEWEALRKKLLEANQRLQTCLSLCDDPGALSYINAGNTAEGLVGQTEAFDVMDLITDLCPDTRTSDLPPEYWIDYLKEKARKQGVPDDILVIYDSLPKCTPCLKRFMNGNTMPYFVFPREDYPREYEWSPWRFGYWSAPELVRMRRMPGFYVTLDIGPCDCCKLSEDSDPTAEDTYPPGAGLTPGVTLDFTSPDTVKAVFYDIYNEPRDFSPEVDESAASPAPPEPFSPPDPTSTPIDAAAVCDECKPIAETILELQKTRDGVRQEIEENERLTEQYREKLVELRDTYSDLIIEMRWGPEAEFAIYGEWIFGDTGLGWRGPMIWPIAVDYDSTLKSLREQIAETQRTIKDLENAREILIKRWESYEPKLQKLYDDLAYCVATRCKNQLVDIPGQEYGYLTTACEPCTDLVKAFNDWLRDRTATRPSRDSLEAQMRASNPGFTDDEIKRAADQVEKDRKADETAYIEARTKEIRECEKRYCAETALDTCKEGDVSVDESGVTFTGKPCKGVPRSSQRRSVQLALPDDPALHSSNQLAPGLSDTWGIESINLFTEQSKAGAKATAERVTVAVIDSGVDYRHPDIADNIWRNAGEIPDNAQDDDNNRYADDVRGWNFVSNSPAVMDNNGHGTLVAGLIAATHNNGLGIAGVNPWADIMALKVTNQQGEGDSLRVAAAIAYAVNNGARVINVSLGGDQYSPAEKAAVEFASRKGALVVVAAGNQGISADAFWPAGIPGVITVAATDPGDTRSAYSNWGQAVDIAAPGSKILSLRASGTDPIAVVDKDYTPGANIVGSDGSLYHATGTSFAAPYVAGVASLLLSLDSTLTIEQVRRMLLQTARDIETNGVDQLTGFGLLDARAAINADPDFFIAATITGVQLGKGGKAIDILGTADADKFASATIELGQGDEPTAWKTLGRLKRPQRDGELASVPTSSLAGSKSWTLRVTTRHKNGAERVGILPLALQ